MRFKQYLQESMFETDEYEIRAILKRSNIMEEDFKFEKNGAVTILKGGFYLSRRAVRNGHIPFKFHEVNGDFFVDGCELVSLDGCPQKVYGNFKCDDNPRLKSLKGGPKFVGQKYSARYTGITTL